MAYGDNGTRDKAEGPGPQPGQTGAGIEEDPPEEPKGWGGREVGSGRGSGSEEEEAR